MKKIILLMIMSLLLLSSCAPSVSPQSGITVSSGYISYCGEKFLIAQNTTENKIVEMCTSTLYEGSVLYFEYKNGRFVTAKVYYELPYEEDMVEYLKESGYDFVDVIEEGVLPRREK